MSVLITTLGIGTALTAWRVIAGWYSSKVEKRSHEDAARKASERQQEEKLRELAERKEEAQRLELARKEMRSKKAAEYLQEATEYLSPCLIIDSNIWMNERYQPFFHAMAIVFKRASYKLTLFGEQFDGIANIKKSTRHGDHPNRCARLALRTIEQFQTLGLLTIQGITIESKRGSNPASLFVQILAAEARKGIRCTFISDNEELRIRVREQFIKLAEADCAIVEMAGFLPKCELIVDEDKAVRHALKESETSKLAEKSK